MEMKKQVFASLLAMSLGATVGCTEEPLVDPRDGEPLTESELKSLKAMRGSQELTQEDVNESARRLFGWSPENSHSESKSQK